MTLRAVVDTNVLVSGLGWEGPPAAVVDAALRGRIQSVTNQELIDELRRVLEYPRLSSVLRTAGLTAAEVVELVTAASVVLGCSREPERRRTAGPSLRRETVCAAKRGPLCPIGGVKCGVL